MGEIELIKGCNLDFVFLY